MADIPITSLGHTVISLGVAFGVLTLVVIILRLVSRVTCSGRIWADDVLITIAAGCTWAFMVTNILAVKHGAGNHLEVVLQAGAQNMLVYAKIVYVSSIFYNASLGFIKCSVLALYARLGDDWLRKASYVVMGICATSATANVLVCIFQCSPIKAAWDTSIVNKTCVDINAFYLANAATNIFTDLLTYLLPIGLVVKLHVPRNQKIAVGVMLSLGLFACISSIVRITYIPGMLKSTDPTLVIAKPYYWSIIEINVGVLAASLPSFKPLVKRFLPRLLGDSSYGRSTPGYKDSSMSRSRGGSFNKLGRGNHKQSSGGSKDMYDIDDKWDMKDPIAMHTGRRIEMVPFDKSSGKSVDAQFPGHHGNGSEEHIIQKSPQGNIVRTVEISRSVEDKEQYGGHHYYPGRAA